MALIHALANTDVPFHPISNFTKFIQQARSKTPEERAKLLETTQLFANIHTETATTGQSAVPTNLDTEFHFTCFVEAPEAEFRERAKRGGETETDGVEADSEGSGMRLVELDGDRAGPIDRGPSNDFLKDVAEVIKRVYVKAHSTNMNFSMLALSQPPVELEQTE